MNDDIDWGSMVFNWKELDGKTVRVAVTESEGVQVVGLYEPEKGHMYFVSVKQIGENK